MVTHVEHEDDLSLDDFVQHADVVSPLLFLHLVETSSQTQQTRCREHASWAFQNVLAWMPSCVFIWEFARGKVETSVHSAIVELGGFPFPVNSRCCDN